MIQNDLNEEVESEIKLLNLKFTSIKSAKNVVIYWYVTLKNLPENTSLDDRVSKIEQSNGSGPIDNLVGFQ